MLVLAWVLVTSRDPDLPLSEWRAVGEFPASFLCAQARDAFVDDAAVREIGALALTEVQNPVRVQAYTKAVGRLRGRYRCVDR